MKSVLSLWMVIALFASRGGHAAESGLEPFFLSAREIPVAAAAGSREPNLFAAADGRVYLNWMEPVDPARYALRFATLAETGWSEPRTVATGADWFVNWSDFPSLIGLPDGWLAAHWLVKNGDESYAYDIHVAYSGDSGATWGAAIVPHRDRTPTQHGFASLLPWAKGGLLIAWLDGRVNAAAAEVPGYGALPTGDMTLHATLLDPQGRLSDEALLDERVCTCCQTAAALTDRGAVLAYRDRSPEEIRDIAIVRLENGRWTKPYTLHRDGWKISGCPINGPALAADGQRLAVAWFTLAQDIPRVNVAFSDDGGKTFSEPVRVDNGNPLGRVDVVLLANGAALVSWLELTSRGEELRFRRVLSDGRSDRAFLLFRAWRGRTSGFPRMARHGNKVFFAWTQPGEPLSIRTAVLTLKTD